MTGGDVSYERDALKHRIIPVMTLSDSSNPLTAAPSPLSPSMAASERASARFAVKGNAIITGGAGNLALVSARALLEHGARGIALLDMESTLSASQKAIQLLRSDFPSARIVDLPCDVTSDEVSLKIHEAATALNRAENTKQKPPFPRIDMLLTFAGIAGCVPSISATASEFRRVIDVNLNGAFLCAQSAAKHMMPSDEDHSRGAGGGRIVFISSISGHTVNFPQPQAAYNISKAGVLHLKNCLAAEWARYGIRVNSISPGYMDTVLNEGANLQASRELWTSRCPMGRMGDAEELTGAVVMLCSERAGGFITGADIAVDGGTLCF